MGYLDLVVVGSSIDPALRNRDDHSPGVYKSMASLLCLR